MSRNAPHPSVNAAQIKTLFSVQPDSQIIVSLMNLDAEITSLRKIGEDILISSKDLDVATRVKVDKTIGISQIALLILFPLFLLVGITALFFIIRSTVSNLKILASAFEKAGKGDFAALPEPSKKDEVGALIEAFNKMENDLVRRDQEIAKKNEELHQSRKLASIGTLASGVAHELNNPLNNIYLAAQILTREMQGQKMPGIIKETVNDIFSQTLRVKRIVSDLLEFAREKPPVFQKIMITQLIREVLNGLSSSLVMRRGIHWSNFIKKRNARDCRYRHALSRRNSRDVTITSGKAAEGNRRQGVYESRRDTDA